MTLEEAGQHMDSGESVNSKTIFNSPTSDIGDIAREINEENVKKNAGKFGQLSLNPPSLDGCDTPEEKGKEDLQNDQKNATGESDKDSNLKIKPIQLNPRKPKPRKP